MSKKILTEELIEQTLAEKGWNQDVDSDYALKKVCEYYDTEITEEWDDDADFFIYTESTADGYEVFVATWDTRTPSINECVYYYDSDLASVLEDALSQAGKVYVEDLEADYVREAAESAYVYLYERLIEEVEMELQDEGYEYEDEEE